jgi:ankyrin repeat protein
VFEAASLDDIDRLRELLDGDPTVVTAYSADGFTALHFPAFFGGVGSARVLLDRGADVEAHGRGWMTGTPLNSAAAGRHADVARLLLDRGADPNARQASGWTPLHSAAHNGDVETVALLIAHGADAAATNDDGATVLSMAEESGNADVIARVRDALGAS